MNYLEVDLYKLGGRFKTLRRELDQVLQPTQDIGISAMIAGGFIRAHLAGEKVRDIDVFFRSEEDYMRAVEHYDGIAGPKVYETKHAIGFEHFALGNEVSLVEVCKFITPCVPDLIAQFDFTICQAGYDGGGMLVVGENYFRDVATKALRLTGCGRWEPMDTLRRVQKYTGYGYTMDAEERLKLYNLLRGGPDVLVAEEPEDRRAS